ncbi:hypothetical protein OHS58_38225 [Amycolatopsis sp. NBC_00348]|uniref:hypothetical protein n=1 Tax=Amycolatopsis sp. NBC_00348 TaxID=2975956 RepID=UPI002E25C62F
MLETMMRGFAARLVLFAALVAWCHVGCRIIQHDGLLRGFLRVRYRRQFHDGSRRGHWARLLRLSFSVFFVVLVAETLGLVAYRVGMGAVTVWVVFLFAPFYIACYLVMGSRTFRAASKHQAGDWSLLDDHDRDETLRDLAASYTANRMSGLTLLAALLPGMVWAGGTITVVTFPARADAGKVGDFSQAGTVASLGLAVFGLYLVQSALRYVFPHRTLIHDAFRLLWYLDERRLSERPIRGAQLPRSFIAARWRNYTHRVGFGLAHYTDRCARGMADTLTPRDHERVTAAYRGVTGELRSHAIKAGFDQERTLGYRQLVVASLALLTVEDPASLPARVEPLVADVLQQPDRSSAGRRRYEAFNAFVQNGWKTISLLIVVILAIVFAVTGQWSSLGGLVK